MRPSSPSSLAQYIGLDVYGKIFRLNARRFINALLGPTKAWRLIEAEWVLREFPKLFPLNIVQHRPVYENVLAQGFICSCSWIAAKAGKGKQFEASKKNKLWIIAPWMLWRACQKIVCVCVPVCVYVSMVLYNNVQRIKETKASHKQKGAIFIYLFLVSKQ